MTEIWTDGPRYKAYVAIAGVTPASLAGASSLLLSAMPTNKDVRTRTSFKPKLHYFDLLCTCIRVAMA